MRCFTITWIDFFFFFKKRELSYNGETFAKRGIGFYIFDVWCDGDGLVYFQG
jgi:hypothetical protein